MKQELREIFNAIIAQLTAAFADKNVTVSFYNPADPQIKIPALILIADEISEGEDRGDERMAFNCKMTGFCILQDDCPQIEFAIREFAAKLIGIIKNNTWNLGDQAAFPENISAQIADFSPANNAVTAWAVDWEQTFYLGENIWAGGVTPSEVVVAFDVTSGGYK